MASIMISCESRDHKFSNELKKNLIKFGHEVQRYEDITASGLSISSLEKLKNVDVLVILISRGNYYTSFGNLELGAALAFSKEQGRPVILTVILGECPIPQNLRETECIKNQDKNGNFAARQVDKFISGRLVEINEVDDFELNKSDPLLLLLGNIDHEGVTSSIRSTGRQYKKKMLESKTENWHSIIRYFEEFQIKGALVKLTGRAFALMATNEYAEVANNLLRMISTVPHKLFVFERLLTGKYEEEDDAFYQPADSIREKVLGMLESFKINIIPYNTNAEVTVIATSFLVETEQNLLFRLYVPANRMWANEADRLLQMFREYLTRVGHLSVRLDQYRTDQGIIYEFHSDEARDEKDLAAEFAEFTQLMDLSISNPAAAEAILVQKNVAPREVLDILTRYSKEAKRLQVDLKHDRERKMLGIRQRLESELVDVLSATSDWKSIEMLVESTVPSVIGSSSALFIDQSPLQIGQSNSSPNITFNLRPQIIQSVNGIVAQEIRGDQHLSHHDQELLSLIQQYGNEKTVELASAVHELSDKSAPSTARLNAKQKLKNFLINVGSRAGDIATDLLKKYIEGQLGM